MALTSTVPALCAGAVTVQVVIAAHSTAVASVVANLNVVALAPVAKPVPLTVTDVPPTAGPLAGVMLVIVGGPKRKRSPTVNALVPFGVVTVTLAVSAADGGEIAVIDDADSLE